MVTDETKSKTSLDPHVAKTVSSLSIVASVNYEKQGPPGVKEALGNYQRISVITCVLFITSIMIGLSAACLLVVELSDIRWQKVVAGQPFPMVNKSKKVTYFENKKLQATPIGKLIHYRRDWVKDKVDFGMDRESAVHVAQIAVMFAILLFCVVHLAAACCFKRVRRCFQLISLGYGFVGLFVFTLCLTTLYFAFVHKVSAYLENALNPPLDFRPTPENKTIEYFINLCYACAFAFSVPNHYAKESYPHWPFPEDSSFSIENATYTKDDLMALGLCPRQDYLLVAVFLLAVTAVLCWLAASYSETLENQIIGPPVWLQRFKVKIHKGIRHWKTRKNIPSHLSVIKPDNNQDAQDNFSEIGSHDREKQHHHHHHQLVHLHPDSEHPTLDYPTPFDGDMPTWSDAYDILDGGVDHILLIDPFNNRGASQHRLYRSSTNISSLDI